MPRARVPGVRTRHPTRGAPRVRSHRPREAQHPIRSHRRESNPRTPTQDHRTPRRAWRHPRRRGTPHRRQAQPPPSGTASRTSTRPTTEVAPTGCCRPRPHNGAHDLPTGPKTAPRVSGGERACPPPECSPSTPDEARCQGWPQAIAKRREAPLTGRPGVLPSGEPTCTAAEGGTTGAGGHQRMWPGRPPLHPLHAPTAFAAPTTGTARIDRVHHELGPGSLDIAASRVARLAVPQLSSTIEAYGTGPLVHGGSTPSDGGLPGD